jgi:hypothetical protein
MDISGYLEQISLIDCNGQVTHTLIRQLDGRISVQFRGGRTIDVDGTTLVVITPGAHLSEALSAAVRSFRQ